MRQLWNDVMFAANQRDIATSERDMRRLNLLGLGRETAHRQPFGACIGARRCQKTKLVAPVDWEIARTVLVASPSGYFELLEIALSQFRHARIRRKGCRQNRTQSAALNKKMRNKLNKTLEEVAVPFTLGAIKWRQSRRSFSTDRHARNCPRSLLVAAQANAMTQ
ncbi:hypothetical protein XEU83M_16020 [Xanthomonas euvesicatoria]|uniref:Transposase n=1 Tax=Xanthomonas axonopodis pv. cajani TaxID=487827 RepID=A0ABX3MBC8_9XANT|nr:hypothetical protein XEU83M_16020 [Xanthomonas euvesicatoria]OOX10454.1 hypothetical protein Xcaj_15945 [Xanthomonas axonopodis pv. cajani]